MNASLRFHSKRSVFIFPVSLTNAFVSFETWQHLCFSVDTQAKLWKFFVDGFMTDIGTFNLSKSYVTDQSAGDNIIKLGEGSCSERTTDEFKKSKCKFRGKMTKPNVWSRVLKFHEISVLATGCETTASPDITTEQTKSFLVKTLSFKRGECISSKGTRLTSNKTQHSSLPSTLILASPWMNVLFERVRGVCMHFNYRLFGKDSELEISVEPRNTAIERLWSIKDSQGNEFWKSGQVSLGLVSEFRVYITAKLWFVGSEASIDNIFFVEDFCDPVPSNAQEWHTKVSDKLSGSIKSPYYPGLYLNNMRRSWTIEVPKGHHLFLKIEFLNLEFHKQCKSDALVVFDSRSSKQAGISYCGIDSISTPFVSASNSLYIVFTTDERDVGTGFMLTYNAIPDNLIEDICLVGRVPDCHSSVICSNIRSNSSKVYVQGSDLVTVPEFFPATTNVINFDHSYLIKLGGDDFKNLTKLEYLSCIDNKIFDVDKETFQNLASLQTLRLTQNYIKSFSKRLFLDLSSLEILDVGKNRIDELNTGLFSSQSNLRTLSLRKNFLKRLNNGVFTGLTNLQYLYLENNELGEIGNSVFDDLTAMKILILNNNKLDIIKSSWLRNKIYLEILDVRKNEIKNIQSGAFHDLRNLVQLDLSGNQLQSIPEDLFENLVSLRQVQVDHFTLCCYAKHSIPNVNCVSKDQDGFSSCDELLKNIVLKYSIWVLGVMAFAGNLIVIIWRSAAKDSNKVNSFLLTNLAVADFMMGIYMLIIAYQDRTWHGVYFKHDFTWRASGLCIFAGVISTVSSEVSVITLTVITIDRLVCIVFPFRFRRWSMKKAASIMCVVWILGFCISLAPLFHDSYFYDFKNNVHFFGRSAVCLPLQLSRERPSGWQYSVSIFLILNGVSFIFILLAYVIMYHTIVKAANAVRSTRMNQDSTLAKRMMFIILTDFFCWFPVIIISILALTGNLYDPSKQVYAWIAVFVLPINSSINPLLYTFSTPYVRKKIPTARRAFSKRGRKRDNGALRRYSSEVSVISNVDHFNTTVSSLSTPQSIRKLGIISEGYTNDDNMAESSFTESTSAIEYRIRMVEDVKYLSDDGHGVIQTCLAVDVDGEETPCLINVYKNEYETLWKATTNILSWLSLDGGHDNILQFLWSAKGANVFVERSDSLASNMMEIKPDDCLVCYELPSRLTLKKFLQMEQNEITEETIYWILNDLMTAIDYLSSKQIVHDAILPENIILLKSSEKLRAPYLEDFMQRNLSTPSLQRERMTKLVEKI
ncbi:uncharacterized protein LOC114519568 isoform X2 [Dendronephthya gigantea]|uniref:uncharacterized protein LOC114519568 isoform X2 n=1 Tax=Dendronephthya gigantea TaxID=151771 RepID=UPI00106BB7BF|nr:uncharacterized protein LOC114519568 isoform X2 [Dendronephthya gigantea]